MALTATLSLDNSCVGTGQPAQGVLTASNTGGTDVTVTAATVAPAGGYESQAFSAGAPEWSSTTVPAGGSTTARFRVATFADESSGHGECGFFCEVTFSDGTHATTNEVELTAISGRGSEPVMPQHGMARYDSNLFSYMGAVLL